MTKIENGNGSGNDVMVALGPYLFEFTSFNNWVRTASRKFEQAEYHARAIICLDRQGRVCLTGKQFMRARDEDAFPVRAYAMIY